MGVQKKQEKMLDNEKVVPGWMENRLRGASAALNILARNVG